jgi:hypothetical protein
MPTWQNELRFVREQIRSTSLDRRDLWHGRIISAEYGSEDEPRDTTEGRNPWILIAAHEPLAGKPVAGIDRCVVGLQSVERGRYFGDRSALSPFRHLVSIAFRALLKGGPHQARAKAISPPRHPSDLSPRWLDLLHDLAENCPSAKLRAPIRQVQMFGPMKLPEKWPEGVEEIDYAQIAGDEDVSSVAFCFLEQDVFTATCAAINLLFNEQIPPEGEDSKPRWDEKNRQLWWRGVVIRVYKRHPAHAQIDIIEAFEKAGWPLTLSESPFGTSKRSWKKLRDTLHNLNAGLPRGTIRFTGDGRGEGVCWGPATDGTPE